MTAPVRAANGSSVAYRQVVVPLDFSPASWQALALGTMLSTAFGAARHVVHVDTSSPWRTEPGGPLLLSVAPGGELVDVQVVSARTPAEGIVHALGDDGGLVVMAAHTGDLPAGPPLGTTTYDLLRRTHGPLLVAGPRFNAMRPLINRIVLCADVAAPPPDALVGEVARWARRLEVPVVVATVTNHATMTDFDAIYDERSQLHAVAEAVGRGGERAPIVRLEGERVAHELVTYADTEPGTVIAMAAHARPLPARMLLGSVTTGVLRQSVSPVLLRDFDR